MLRPLDAVAQSSFKDAVLSQDSRDLRRHIRTWLIADDPLDVAGKLLPRFATAEMAAGAAIVDLAVGRGWFAKDSRAAAILEKTRVFLGLPPRKGDEEVWEYWGLEPGESFPVPRFVPGIRTTLSDEFASSIRSEEDAGPVPA